MKRIQKLVIWFYKIKRMKINYQKIKFAGKNKNNKLKKKIRIILTNYRFWNLK